MQNRQSTLTNKEVRRENNSLLSEKESVCYTNHRLGFPGNISGTIWESCCFILYLAKALGRITDYACLLLWCVAQLV